MSTFSGCFTGEGTPRVVAHRADAGIEVEHLAQGDVQAADAAADRRGEGSLDGHPEVLDGVQSVLGQPLARLVEGLLPGQHLEPGDGAGAAVGLLHRPVEHAARGLPDVRPRAIPLDEGDDGPVRHLQTAFARMPDDLPAIRGRSQIIECPGQSHPPEG